LDGTKCPCACRGLSYIGGNIHFSSFVFLGFEDRVSLKILFNKFLAVFLSELQESASDFPDLMRRPEPLEFDVRLNIERFADPPQK
jgi:hypothetical protein